MLMIINLTMVVLLIEDPRFCLFAFLLNKLIIFKYLNGWRGAR